MIWLGPVPTVRNELHYGDRLVRCYADRPRSLDAMLRNSAGLSNGQGEAVADENRRLTYAALDAEVEAVSAGLSQHGIAKGDRVAILLSNSVEFVVAFYATQRIGAIAVPMNIREQEPEITYVLNHCAASAIFHDAALADRLPLPGSAPSLRLRIGVGGVVDGSLDYAVLAAEDARAPDALTLEEDVAVILYTSGTTGKPKGAMLTHLGLISAAINYSALMGLRPGDRCAVPVPMSHVTGITAGLLPMVYVGGCVVSLRAFKAAAFLNRAAEERMAVVVMVPAMYALCLLQPSFANLDLSSWRVGGFGGAQMAAATIEQLNKALPGLALINCYGATETSGAQAMGPPADALSKRSCVGVPIPIAEMLVVDDDGIEVPQGHMGEIWMRGSSISPGYWEDPAATAREFQAGFWKSGDLGRIDEDGFVQVLDRKKDMLNRGGYKIYSSEVEQVLMEIPGVLEAAIVGKPCPVLGERVHAFVTVTTLIDAEQLRAHCATQLSDYKVPESFTVDSHALPRNANGKILKRELRDALLAVA